MKFLPTLILLASGIFAAAPAWSAQRFNVLFISVDDLRPELGCYGYREIKTPNIDRLAARGLVFNRAYCQQALCSPSRSSLMTGRRPDATRVWNHEVHFRTALPHAQTLPQYFKAQGYYCVALSKIFHPGFEDGPSWSEPQWFPNGQTVDTKTGDWTKRIVKRVGPSVQEYSQGPSLPADNDKPNAGRSPKARKGPAFEVSPKSDDALPDGYTAAEAVKRLHQLKAKDQPFFLAVGFLKPHLPFVAPKKYWELYDPDKIPVPAIEHLPQGAPAFAGHDNAELHEYATVPTTNPIPTALAKTLRHGYYACVSYVDAQVGRLLNALEQEGLSQNTIIVLWGDHGWHLGDHGLWCKHTNFELATRVPLLLSVPRQPSAGAHCNAPVELVDLYPTLTELCRLPVPAGLDGASLAPLLAHPDASVKPVAISEYPRGGGSTGGRALIGYSIRDARWRLTLWRDRHNGTIAATELYDEQNDPDETTNLAATQPEVVARLRAFLPPSPGTASPSQPRPDRPPQDRAALFAKKDQNRDGQLNFQEFMANQPDPDEARKRFEQFDTNQDHSLSSNEFIHLGATPKR